MKDYSVEFRIKNNWLKQRMLAAGFSSVRQLAIHAKVHESSLGRFMNLQQAPIGKRGEWSRDVLRVSEVLRCMPEDLFPPQHINDPLERNRAEIELALEEVPALIRAANPMVEGPDVDLDRRQMADVLHNALKSLPPRTQKVLRMRFGLDIEPKLLAEVGKEIGVTPARVRQIERKGLRMLKRRIRNSGMEDEDAISAIVGT